MAQVYNPLGNNGKGDFDIVSSGSGSTAITEVSTDPSSPTAQQAWVLKTTTGSGGTAGTPLGLLLALTDAGGSSSTTYQFSYYTNEGTIIRATLS